MEKVDVLFFNRIRWNKNQKISFHSHQCFELVYYYDSVGEVYFKNQSYSFAPGNFCLIPLEWEHSELHKAVGDTIFIGLKFESELVKEPTMLKDRDELILNTVKRIYLENLEKKENYQEMVRFLCNQLLIDLKRKIKEDTGRNQDNIVFIFNYLNEHFSSKTSLDDISKQIGYSSGYVRKIFKKTYGIPPRDYIVNLRLNKAYDLITNSTMSCTEVALYCGFSDSSQFSKLFKKKYNITPKKLQSKK